MKIYDKLKLLLYVTHTHVYFTMLKSIRKNSLQIRYFIAKINVTIL